MKSSQESRATVPQRLMCSRREEKLAENQSCVTGKDLQVGGEAGREGLREKLGLQRKRDALERLRESEGKNAGSIK